MKNTEKFTTKADNYAKYRPSYPLALIQYLEAYAGLKRTAVATDVGAGTGILTKLLAQEAGSVWAVEPNEGMRKAGINYCKGLSNVAFVDGDAEKTTLKDCCCDLITAAQAFHWFHKDRAAAEFQRILKPEGKVVLIWNRKEQENAIVSENIEISRRYCPGFSGDSSGMNYEDDGSFNIFRNGAYEHRVYKNDIEVTLEAFVGWNLSVSYALESSDAGYNQYIDSLKKLFEKHSVNGRLVIPNNTHCYSGYV